LGGVVRVSMGHNMTDTQDVKIAVLETQYGHLKEQLNTHHTITNEKLDKVIDKLTLMNGSIGKAHIRIDDLEPHIEDYKINKKRAIVGLIGIGGATGVIGSKISALVSGWLS